MTGLRLNLPTAFTDTALPVLRNDPMLAKGSLALYELGHPGTGITGVPANLGLVPNIAVNEAKALIPAATDSTFSAVIHSGPNSASAFKAERTGKGGLHGIVSKANPPADSTAYIGMYGPAGIAQYIRDHINNEFFISYWGKETRTAANATAAFAGLTFSTNPSATNLHFVLSHDGNNYPNTSKKTGAIRNVNGAAFSSTMADTNANFPPTIPANIRLNIGVKGSDGSLDRDGANVAAARYFKLFSVGRFTELYGHSTAGSSHIHYRTYIEDLTVSGRTYAQAAAVDAAEYTKHVLTAGGRYYGDTYTAPSTIA